MIDLHAAGILVGLLADADDLDGLRALADAGSWTAAERLADLLAEAGDLERLRARVQAGDEIAAERLAGLLARRLAEAGDLDGLQALADAGSRDAAGRLAGLLAEAGDLDGAAQILGTRVVASDEWVAVNMADLLIKQGRREEAERLGRFGLNLDGSIACALRD